MKKAQYLPGGLRHRRLGRRDDPEPAQITQQRPERPLGPQERSLLAAGGGVLAGHLFTQLRQGQAPSGQPPRQMPDQVALGLTAAGRVPQPGKPGKEAFLVVLKPDRRR